MTILKQNIIVSWFQFFSQCFQDAFSDIGEIQLDIDWYYHGKQVLTFLAW
jgi:hypothetical protein